MTRWKTIAASVLAIGLVLTFLFREWLAISLLRSQGYVSIYGWHVDSTLHGRSFNPKEPYADHFRRALAILPWSRLVNRVDVPAMPDLQATLTRLAAMDHIVAIDLPNAGVKDDDLAGLAGMTNLAFLDLSRNPEITDAGIVALAGLKNLRYLNVAKTKVTGVGFQLRPEMLSLQSLDLNDCPVTDESLADIPRYPKLFQIFLGGTQVTDRGLMCLVGSPWLQRVTPSRAMTREGADAFNEAFLAARRKAREAGKPVSDRDIPPVFMDNWRDDPVSPYEERAMARDPKVREEAIAVLGNRIMLSEDGAAKHVQLRGTDTAPELMQAIEAFPELKELQILEARIDPAAATHAIERLPALERVLFIRCPTVTDDMVPVIAGLPKLRTLSLEGCPITDHGLPPLLQSQTIEAIILDDTGITDDGIATLAELPKLERLHIGNTAVTDRGVEALQGHKYLGALWAHRSRIGDAGIGHLATCPRLVAVHALRTKCTDEGIEAIAAAKKLMVLEAGGTFSRRSIKALEACPRLNTLRLEGTIDLGDEDIEAFAPFHGIRFMELTGSHITDFGESRLKEMLPKARIVVQPGT